MILRMVDSRNIKLYCTGPGNDDSNEPARRRSRSLVSLLDHPPSDFRYASCYLPPTFCMQRVSANLSAASRRRLMKGADPPYLGAQSATASRYAELA